MAFGLLHVNLVHFELLCLYLCADTIDEELEVSNFYLFIEICVFYSIFLQLYFGGKKSISRIFLCRVLVESTTEVELPYISLFVINKLLWKKLCNE